LRHRAEILTRSGPDATVRTSVISPPMKVNPFRLRRCLRPGGRRANRRTPWLLGQDGG
jgi:hypothetical protein